jgi:hypothetical protein
VSGGLHNIVRSVVPGFGLYNLSFKVILALCHPQHRSIPSSYPGLVQVLNFTLSNFRTCNFFEKLCNLQCGVFGVLHGPAPAPACERDGAEQSTVCTLVGDNSRCLGNRCLWSAETSGECACAACASAMCGVLLCALGNLRLSMGGWAVQADVLGRVCPCYVSHPHGVREVHQVQAS